MDGKTILHADLDAFYASVEQRDDATLQGRPMMVGAGVVLAASYEARHDGVRTAMSVSQARRLCPEIIEVPPRMDAYAAASKAVFDIFHDTTPEVEGLSIDEAFLDVTGLRKLIGPGRLIAERLRARVLDEVGLTISVGCASTKFLAKVASTVSKPNGLLVIEPGKEIDFLHPLPVERLWGAGPVTAARLRAGGLLTIGHVATAQPGVLTSLIGERAGQHLQAISNNEDSRPVVVGRRRRSIGSQRSFPRRQLEPAEVDVLLLEVVDAVAGRLRVADRVARTVVLRLRFGDFKTATRSFTLPQATASTDLILQTARRLLRENWQLCSDRGLTRVGISVTNLVNADAVQLAFDLGGPPPELDHTIDEIRRRFGKSSIGPAALVDRPDRSVPKLPD